MSRQNKALFQRRKLRMGPWEFALEDPFISDFPESCSLFVEWAGNVNLCWYCS